jgi:hypothetical protein
MHVAFGSITSPIGFDVGLSTRAHESTRTCALENPCVDDLIRPVATKQELLSSQEGSIF